MSEECGVECGGKCFFLLSDHCTTEWTLTMRTEKDPANFQGEEGAVIHVYRFLKMTACCRCNVDVCKGLVLFCPSMLDI